MCWIATDSPAAWTTETYMLANLVDAWSEKPVPRPGSNKKPDSGRYKAMSVSELRKFMSQKFMNETSETHTAETRLE